MQLYIIVDIQHRLARPINKGHTTHDSNVCMNNTQQQYAIMKDI